MSENDDYDEKKVGEKEIQVVNIHAHHQANIKVSFFSPLLARL